MASKDKKKKRGALGKSLVGATRFIVTLPVVGLFVSALFLSLQTFLETFLYIGMAVVDANVSQSQVLVEIIECADHFLLAIILYIMSIGLYSLFIDSDIKIPKWLEIHTLNDLKEKLIGVIVVIMGVFFLGRLLEGGSGDDLLRLGAGIGIVVFALGYFVHQVMLTHVGHKAEDEGSQFAALVEELDASPYGSKNDEEAEDK